MAQDNYNREFGTINLNSDNLPLPGLLPYPQPDLLSIDSVDKIRNSLPQGGGIKPVSEMVADMFPGFGELSSAVDIGNNLKNGNYGMAALGLGMFAVPSAARKAGKYIHNPIRRFFNHTGHKIRGVWDKFRYGIKDRMDAFSYYNRYKNEKLNYNPKWKYYEGNERGIRRFTDFKYYKQDLIDRVYEQFKRTGKWESIFPGKALLHNYHYLRPYELTNPQFFVDFPWLTGTPSSRVTERSWRSILGSGKPVPKDVMEHMEREVYPNLPSGSVVSADAPNISLGEYMLDADNGWQAFWRGVFGRPQVAESEKFFRNMLGKSADAYAWYHSFGTLPDKQKAANLMPTSLMIKSPVQRHLYRKLKAYLAKHDPLNFRTIYNGKSGWFNSDATRNSNVYRVLEAYRNGVDLDEFKNLFGYTPDISLRVGDLYKIDAYLFVDWLNKNYLKPIGARRAHVDLHGNPYWYNPAIWRYLKGGKTLNNYGAK